MQVLHTYADFLEGQKSWFDEEYASKLGRRFVTLKLALQRAVRGMAEKNLVIVETGCVRQAEDYGAGYSTVIFGQFLTRYGGELHTVDITERFLKICIELTAPYADKIRYNLGHSVDFLRDWPKIYPGKKIDLLYLDSYDYPLAYEGIEAENEIRKSQQHCLEELERALPSLHEKSVVLIDDGDLWGGGKPHLAKQRLTELGWVCLHDDYQTLWTPK